MKPLLLLDAVQELGEGLLMPGRQVEEAGVGRRVERRLLADRRRRGPCDMGRQLRPGEHPDELLVAVGDEVGGAGDEDQPQQRPCRRQPEAQLPAPPVGLGRRSGECSRGPARS